MQQRSILIVDEDDTRRRALAGSMAARGQRYLDVGDAFAAMAALGRADFGAVLACEGRRTLSLRGLCQLARKRHPDILIFVLPKPGSDDVEIRKVLELPIEMLGASLPVERIVTDLLASVDAAAASDAVDVDIEPTRPSFTGLSHDASTETFDPFDMPSTADAEGVFDSVPRVDVPTFLLQEPTSIVPSTVPSIMPSSGPVDVPAGLPADDPPGQAPALPQRTPRPVFPAPGLPAPGPLGPGSGQLPESPPFDPLNAPTEPVPFDLPGLAPPGAGFGGFTVPPTDSDGEPGLVITGVLAPPEAVIDDLTRPDARRPSNVSTSQQADVFFDGHFEDVDGGAGAALLMGLFSQDLTGRLTCDDGDARGTAYLYRGEPVWADDPEGDAGLYRKLVQKKFLQPDLTIESVPDGQLLGSLMQGGQLSGQQMHDFMREVVRDRVLALAVQLEGTYRFIEDKAFLDTAPLLKVNPFGLILDSRRRRLPPPALMAVSSEIERKYLVPLPALQAASEKLKPFTRGAKASDVINGAGTVKEFLEQVGLDPFMGSLVVVVMADARLVSIEDQPRTQGIDLAEKAFTGEQSMEIRIDDGETPPSDSAEDAQAREDIFALYMRLKPLSQPRQVLGIGLEAAEAAIDAAYQQRMSELDPRRIPEGSAQHMLGQRIEELRRKVTSAYQTLKMQSVAPGGESDNPF